ESKGIRQLEAMTLHVSKYPTFSTVSSTVVRVICPINGQGKRRLTLDGTVIKCQHPIAHPDGIAHARTEATAGHAPWADILPFDQFHGILHLFGSPMYQLTRGIKLTIGFPSEMGPIVDFNTRT